MATDRIERFKDIDNRTHAYLATCWEHARTLVTNARLVMERGNAPHIAFHLAALALEEIGKGALALSTALHGPQENGEGLLAKYGDDHVRKLFWGLWAGPTSKEMVTPKGFTELRELAFSIHQERIQGLYVSTDPTSSVPPSKLISLEKAENLVRLAELSLEMQSLREFSALDPSDATNLAWMLDAAYSTESEAHAIIFSQSSLRKLAEFQGDPKPWLSWLRDQERQREQYSREMLSLELARERPTREDRLKPKWKFRIALYSDSHIIRQKAFSKWNQEIEFIKLSLGDKKKRELLVDVTLPLAIDVKRLPSTALDKAAQLLVAFNMGTRGFFSPQPLGERQHPFLRVTDLLSKSDLRLSNPELKVDWQGGMLSQEHLNNVMLCLHAQARISGQEAIDALRHYHAAIGFLAKTDVYTRFEQHAFASFYFSLKEAIRHFEALNSESDYQAHFESWLRQLLSVPSEISKYLLLVAPLDRSEAKLEKVALEEVAVMKALADIYFIRNFRRASAL